MNKLRKVINTKRYMAAGDTWREALWNFVLIVWSHK